MTSSENLHYAIGELAYAMARIDGIIQKEEREKFFDIISTELAAHHENYDVSKIVFEVMERDKISPDTTYAWAMKEIKLNSHYLSPELKQSFIAILEKIAGSFPPVTPAEQSFLDRFKRDIEPLVGDPVFYKSKLKVA